MININRTGDAQASRSRSNGTTWTVPYKILIPDAFGQDAGGVLRTAYSRFLSHVVGAAPTYLGNAWETIDVSGTQEAPGLFNATVVYSPRGNERENRRRAAKSFSTRTQTEHFTHSFTTAGTYFDSSVMSAAVDWGKAVNATIDEIRGYDRHVPTWNHSFTVDLPDSMVTQTFAQSLFALSGTINSASVWFFAAHECLFLGCDGSDKWEVNEETEEEEHWWTLTFSFAGMPTVSRTFPGINNGQPITKPGWDYFWTTERQTLDANNLTKRKTVQVNVERVYPEADFSFFSFLN